MATYKTIVVTLPKSSINNGKEFVKQNCASRIIKVSKSHNTIPIKLTTSTIQQDDLRTLINNDNTFPGSQSSEKAPRKRQKLDHLSLEQKIMRRKMKNRVAAQTARDRKKSYMDDLEHKIGKMSSELRTAKAFIVRLQQENAKLFRKNQDFKSQLKDCKCSDIKQMFSNSNSKPSHNGEEESSNRIKEEECVVIEDDCFGDLKTKSARVSVPVSPECLESSELLSQQRKLHSGEAVIIWTLILAVMLSNQKQTYLQLNKSTRSQLRTLHCANPRSFPSKLLFGKLLGSILMLSKAKLNSPSRIGNLLSYKIDKWKPKKKLV